jgi:Cdc6-like AAA superfamily ATPase
MTNEDKSRNGLLAGKAFSPSAPVRDRDVFAGRREQLHQILDAINQDGQSVLIYGERGVGKTSLANVVDDFYLSVANARVFAPHVNCDSDDDFHSIWMKVLEKGQNKRPTAGLSESVQKQIAKVLSSAGDRLTPANIRHIAELVTQTHLFIPIIDEFDRVLDDQTVVVFTDTIKALSDHTRATTVILVAVGDTVDDLIGQHESIERSLVQVQMRRMSSKESKEILTKSMETTGVEFSKNAQQLIVSLARGLPHYTHLLGLHSLRAAVEHGEWVISESHVEGALDRAMGASQQSLQRAYHSATTSPRKDNLFAQVLLACALAPTDDLEYFAAADVRPAMTKIMGRTYGIGSFSQHLASFTEEDRGGVLQRIGQSRRYRFRFRNPLLQPFVVMKGLSKSLITKADLQNLNDLSFEL